MLRLLPKHTEKLGDWDKLPESFSAAMMAKAGKLRSPSVRKQMDDFTQRFREAKIMRSATALRGLLDGG